MSSSPSTPTIDAGSFSNLCTRFLNKRYTSLLRAVAPIAHRTRSRTMSPRKNTHRISKNSTPNSGSFKKLAGPAAQRRAARALSIKRQDLKTLLQSSLRDCSIHKRYSTWQCIRQLGPLDQLPEAIKRAGKPFESMEAERAAKTKKRKSMLWLMERMLSEEEEMEIEFGLLPGEERPDEEGGLYAEMEVVEWQVVDEEVIEEMEKGEIVGGVWREVTMQGSEEMQMIAHEAWKQNVEAAEAKTGALMDRRCVDVVNGVWEWLVRASGACMVLSGLCWLEI